MEPVVSFFVENTPPWSTILVAGPLWTVWALGCLYLAGWLKRDRRWPTGYTRKVFHFLIFFTAAVTHLAWGTPMVCLFGGMVTCVLLLAIGLGPGHMLYEAIAREKDAPHRTHYIVVAYVATLLGGLSANILFGPAALAGYLVTGIGDAVGEPVGTRFGRHTYRVPSRSSVPALRSWEGSAAVFAASLAALFLAAILGPDMAVQGSRWVLVPAAALLCALLEAVSPHGWDNLTLQLVPSGLAWLCF